jgi:hypothetical protein
MSELCAACTIISDTPPPKGIKPGLGVIKKSKHYENPCLEFEREYNDFYIVSEGNPTRGVSCINDGVQTMLMSTGDRYRGAIHLKFSWTANFALQE